MGCGVTHVRCAHFQHQLGLGVPLVDPWLAVGGHRGEICFPPPSPDGSVPNVDDYLRTNRELWDERAPAHAASPDYGLDRFIADSEYLSDVVRFDRQRLGDIGGLRGVHLQCHIGTDTISLARLGARMSGLDFSSASIDVARNLAAGTGTPIEFVVGDLDAAPDLLDREAFDLVFTGIGALCWLPDIDRWAAVVRGLLAPGGRLFLREGHPMMWALDEGRDDLLVVRYPYFRADPLVMQVEGSYARTDVALPPRTEITFTHALGEIITALLDQGLQITGLVEHQSLPWDALPGQMELLSDGEWRLRTGSERLPLTYTLQAVRPG